MSTNNFDHIYPLLTFDDEDKFYYLQILARKKDNPEGKSVKVIKNFYFNNEQYLIDREENIIDMCHYFNARAYLRMNRRSYKGVADELNIMLAKSLKYNQYKYISRLYSKACGSCHVEKNKIWVIDIDDGDGIKHYDLMAVIDILHYEGNNRDYKIIKVLDTPNGKHILTNPFNVQKFAENTPLKKEDIKKDNPTILYAP